MLGYRLAESAPLPGVAQRFRERALGEPDAANGAPPGCGYDLLAAAGTISWGESAHSPARWRDRFRVLVWCP